MNRSLFLRLWSLAMGGMDACTGLLLVLAPAFTLRLMGVPAVAGESLVYLSWMGVFIGSVGLAYGLALRGAREGETVWLFTGMVRALVAVFVSVKILSGALPAAWWLVAVADAAVAAGQFVILRLGWWKGESR